MQQTLVFFISAVLLTWPTVSMAENSDDQSFTVTTASASFRGKSLQVNPYLLPDYQATIAAYTRIPYAEPPVGDLRFRRPVPKVIEGSFDATRGSVACSQMTSDFIDFEMDTEVITIMQAPKNALN